MLVLKHDETRQSWSYKWSLQSLWAASMHAQESYEPPGKFTKIRFILHKPLMRNLRLFRMKKSLSHYRTTSASHTKCLLCPFSIRTSKIMPQDFQTPLYKSSWICMQPTWWWLSSCPLHLALYTLSWELMHGKLLFLEKVQAPSN